MIQPVPGTLMVMLQQSFRSLINVYLLGCGCDTVVFSSDHLERLYLWLDHCTRSLPAFLLVVCPYPHVGSDRGSRSFVCDGAPCHIRENLPVTFVVDMYPRRNAAVYAPFSPTSVLFFLPCSLRHACVSSCQTFPFSPSSQPSSEHGCTLP